MYWSIGYDEHWKRDIGFGVDAICDHPGCKNEIDRGIEHVCGGEPYGGDSSCGLYFCKDHLQTNTIDNEEVPQCTQCSSGKEPFEPTPDTENWLNYKQTSSYWAGWRTYHEQKASS